MLCCCYFRWDQEPAVVNAFYNPNTNDIGKQNLKIADTRTPEIKNVPKR